MRTASGTISNGGELLASKEVTSSVPSATDAPELIIAWAKEVGSRRAVGRDYTTQLYHCMWCDRDDLDLTHQDINTRGGRYRYCSERCAKAADMRRQLYTKPGTSKENQTGDE